MSNIQTIEVDIPKGYEAVDYRKVKFGESFYDGAEVNTWEDVNYSSIYKHIIVKEKEPRKIPLNLEVNVGELLLLMALTNLPAVSHKEVLNSTDLGPDDVDILTAFGHGLWMKITDSLEDIEMDIHRTEEYIATQLEELKNEIDL